MTLPLLSTQAVNEVSPQLFTIATLTGHAIRAMGPNYSVSTAEAQTISSRACLTVEMNVKPQAVLAALPLNQISFD